MILQSRHVVILIVPAPALLLTVYNVGMTKVEEKLKAGRAKRPEGSGFSEDSQRRPAATANHPSKKDPATSSSGDYAEKSQD